jgi:hypothetical protein
MGEKEYIVTLHKDVDYPTFDTEMVATTGNGFIPDRSPVVADARLGSLRNTHYMLTFEEAELLKSDPRVMDVELTLDQLEYTDIITYTQQGGNFTKTSSSAGSFLNWGMVRMNHSENPYGATDSPTAGEIYNYTLDGTGVDVVISDSGIQKDHPEFQDADGNSRVQEIDWFTESGISGTQHADHYRDFDGHGTHVAGTAAGKTYGWAKNARIYSVKVSGLEGAGDATGISIAQSQDVIKGWHNNKPVDPLTGFKRPTVVNMSWGYGSNFQNITGGIYRGTTWSGTSKDTSKGMIGGLQNSGYYRFVTRNASVDADIQEMVDAGIHVCIAAGNSSQKCDLPGGLDYDNQVYRSIGNAYYNRGGSPFSSEAFMVGNIDRYTSTITSGLDQKNNSSECGPAVNIYAPGTNIISTMSNTNAHGSSQYPYDGNFGIRNLTGTSMASPQICGMVALQCQVNPSITPSQMHQSIISNATDKLYTTGLDNDYTNGRSLGGSSARCAYNKFNSSIQLNINGLSSS